MARDLIIKYYDKREPYKKRKYYNSTDELYKAKGRFEYIGRYVSASWLGIKDFEIDI